MAASASSNSIAGKYLTEDIWFQIFFHLSLDSIFKFRCVSKAWFSILSNPSFINNWYELNYLSLPWGFFIHDANSREDQFRDNKFRSNFAIAYPDSHSQFISHRVRNGFSLNFLNPIFPNYNNRGIPYLNILGSSNGLVLCSTVLSNQRRYIVCNPLTKKWVSHPPPSLPSTGMAYIATGFICSNECDSVSYKVICIPQFEAAAKEFKVAIFSSELGVWNIYDVSRPQYFKWDFPSFGHFVAANGSFYWMRKDYNNILAFNVNININHEPLGNECRLINLPDIDVVREYMIHYLGESEGLICYARIEVTERSLSVWVLEEDWNLVYKDINFFDKLTEMVSWLNGRAITVDEFEEIILQIQVLGLSPVDKNVVVLAYRKYIWAYNTRTKGYEQLRYPSFMGSNVFVSHMHAFALKLRPTILQSNMKPRAQVPNFKW